MKRSLAAALLFVLLPAAHAQQPPGTLSPAERQRIETQLRDARERLEKAAREVGQLSGKLTGPIAYDYLVSRQLDQKGAVLGVTIEEDDTDSRKDGVVVQNVVPRGPADKAGIREDDVIVALNGKTLREAKSSPARALVKQMEAVKPGEKVKVDLLRNGKRLAVDVVAQTPAADVFTMRAPPVIGFGGDAENWRRAQEQARLQAKAFTPPADPNVMFFNHFAGGGMMDMELVAVTPKLGRYFGVDSGLLVVRPPKGSELKLEEGDVIVDIDGRKPEDSAHAMRILRSYQPGEQVTFGVMRDRKMVKIPVAMPKEGLSLNWSAPQIRTFITPPEPPSLPEPPAPPRMD